MDIGKLNKRITLLTNKWVENEIVPQPVSVWARKKSVRQSEFYTAYQTGLNLQIVFEIRLSAYELSLVIDESGEERYAAEVMYKGRTYNIVRTYELDDTLELVCS